jgi:HD domain
VALLLSLDPPHWHLRHSRAVAETAAWLALRAREAGHLVDRRLAESAALLHDVDKLPALRPQVDGTRHGDGAAIWLAGRGYGELGPVVAGHPVTRLADADWYGAWLRDASPEALIVSYSDKRAGQRLEPMAGRFASWERRYPPAERAGRTRGSWSIETVELVRGRSEEIERRVCRLAGVSPQDVGRLRWTGRAIASVLETGVHARRDSVTETPE